MNRSAPISLFASTARVARICAAAAFVAVLTFEQTRADEAYDHEIRGAIDTPTVEYFGIRPLHNSYLRTKTIFAGDDSSEGIRLAIEAALSFDPKLRQTLEQGRVRKAEVWRAYAAFLPTVSASLRHSHGTDIVSSLRSTTTRAHENVFEVEASIPVMTSGARIFRLKRAKAELKAARYDTEAAGNDVLTDAANAYLDLLASKKRQEALRRSTGAVARIVEITRSKYRRGFADRSDVALAQAKLAQVRREYEAAVEQRENAETQFRVTVGSLPPGTLVEPTGAALPAGSADEAVALALKHNPRLQSARSTAHAARFGVREAISERLPRVDLTGSYENGLSGYDTGENWNIGVKLTVPLIDPDAIPAISGKKHEAWAARYRAQDTQRDIEKLIRRQWSAYHSADRQLGHEGKRLESLRRAALAATKRYEHGYAAIDDVLTRQLEVLDSEVALADLEAVMKAAAYRIAIETGI